MKGTGDGWSLGGKLLSINQLAEHMGVDRVTIYRHRRTGKLPLPIKIGRKVCWIQEEIKAWLEAGAPNLRKWSLMPESKPWQGKMVR